MGALRAVISKAARLRRHGLLEPHDIEDMLDWDHGGGLSLDTSVRTEASDRAGLERLIRCCARPPFALDRLHLVGNRSDQIPEFGPADPEPVPDHTSRGARDFDQSWGTGPLGPSSPAGGAPGTPKSAAATAGIPPHPPCLTPPASPTFSQWP